MINLYQCPCGAALDLEDGTLCRPLFSRIATRLEPKAETPIKEEAPDIKASSPAQTWIDKGFEAIKACNYVGEATALFDKLIDRTKTDAERKEIRERFVKWKQEKPASMPYNAKKKEAPKARKPTRIKGKNEEEAPIRGTIPKRRAR